jgi:Family of unknown function (DUF6680)
MDWTVKVTDLAIVFATLTGPFLAVYVTERQRKRADARNRRIHIFRTLMATRAATLAGAHIEALNLVELEFAGVNRKHDAVIDAWKMYKSHLYDTNYPQGVPWEVRRKELMVELLYTMSNALGYSFEKSQINTAAYYPGGYAMADLEQLETRQLWLKVLKGERELPMRARVFSGETEFPTAAVPLNRPPSESSP